MKKLLVPTDFSNCAENALRFAIQVGSHFGSEITLFSAFRTFSTTGVFSSVERFMEEEVMDDLKSLIAKMEPLLPANTRLVASKAWGDAVPAIIQIAEKKESDLIVMGTMGTGLLKEIFTGGRTLEVVKSSPKPILVVPGEWTEHQLQSIVLAVDDRGLNDISTLQPLVNLAKAFNATVRIFHLETGNKTSGLTHQLAELLSDVKYSFHYEFSRSDIKQSIDEFAEDYEADMLCLIRRKRGFWERIFHESVTSRKASDSTIPLLILHEG